MIITPAILTKNKHTFTELLKKYSKMFEYIDIDYITKRFTNNNSVSSYTILNSIQVYLRKSINIGIHLMTSKPILFIQKLEKFGYTNKKLRLYIHQESEYSEILKKIYLYKKNWHIGIVINCETKLKNLDFYKIFDEVQIMTVKIGKQGNKFQEKSLEKTLKLKQNGYKGLISIDGGVNLETAKIIKKYPIDRLSVGSFFQQSDDLENDYKKLSFVFGINKS